MNDDALTLGSLLGPCPRCGHGQFKAVFDGEATNLLCQSCGSCWTVALEWACRINPATCPGCPSRSACLAAPRPYRPAIAEIG